MLNIDIIMNWFSNKSSGISFAFINSITERIPLFPSTRKQGDKLYCIYASNMFKDFSFLSDIFSLI